MLLPQRRKPVNKPDAAAGVAGRALHVVTTAKFVGATRKLIEPLAGIGIALENWSWDRFTTETALPSGAWAIADFDRVHPWSLELAASRSDALTAAGAVVMNDPRRFLTRAPLIRSLYALGINRYTCWLPAFGEVPERFPVFLRTLAAHRGVLTGLLETAAEAEAALRQALAEGYTITDLGFIEYRAEAAPGVGHYQKHAAYRIGNRVLRALSVNDDSWMAKTGIAGLASEETYAAELAEFDGYPHAEVIRRVTDLCGCTFGRVDFGIVAGRVEVYELNSNPTFGFVAADHPSALRRASSDRHKDQLLAAFDAVVPPAGPTMIDVSHLPLWPKNRP
jgi:hypothetical protein